MPQVLTIRMRDGSTDHLSRPASIIEIDSLLCKGLGVECHPVHWHRGWVDSIGFSLACGKTWNEIREIWEECDELIPVIDWLEANTEAEGHYSRH